MTLDNGCLRELGRQLIEEPSWTRRAKAAERLGEIFCAGALSADERSLVEGFFRLTSFDEEILVRRVLAESLKRTDALSRETFLVFAADRAEVAAPLIEHSPLFEENDLLQILEARSVAHRLALARRFRVTEPICGLLIASGDETLIVTLLHNRGAAIGEDQLWRLIASPPIRPRVVAALKQRRALLPPRILAGLLELHHAFSFGVPASGWCAPGEMAWRGLVAFAGRRGQAGAERGRARPSSG
ncbi:MAG TPA: DUF2336 domain-containing protein [Stellaceae bacterium]|nr:DUF2336 domain-containing protein [Stellaceae bacterium]